MKKIIILSSVFLMSMLTANATVSIQWISPPGSITDSSGTSTGPADIDGWLVQFIAIDNNTGPISTPTVLNPFVLNANERLLGEQVVNSRNLANGSLAGASIPENYADDIGGQSIVGGYAYARVYNVAASSSAGQTPTWYGVSAILGDANRAGGPLIALDPNTPSPDVNRLSPAVDVNMQLIPEPSTYALLGFGGLIMLWRARRDK